MLKQKIIDTGFFCQNSYLDTYIELICKNQNTPDIPRVTQAHHVVPRSCFQHRNLTCDDTVVNLVYSDHVLAHFYLYKCCNDQLDKMSNACAVMFMMSRNTLPESEKEVLQVSNELNNVYAEFQAHLNSAEIQVRMDAAHKITCNSAEWRSKMSKIVSENSRLHPWKWITNGVIQLRVEVGSTLPEGFRYGRLPVQNETKEKIRQSVIEHNSAEEYRQHQSQKAKEAWDRGCYAERDNTGHAPWNKGQTKDTSDTLRCMGERHRGYKHTESAKETMRQKRLGKLPSNCIRLRCKSSGKIYESLKEAVNDTGISAFKIKKSLENTDYLADGTQWEQVKEKNENNNT